MIIGIDHIEIVVADIDAMSTFFQTLGFTEVRRTDHHGQAVEMLVPGTEGTIIEFHTGHATEPPGLNHIAFRVDDCAATVEELRGAGVPIPRDAKVAANSGRLVASFRDPMYQRWQLAE
ncbi:hypothetical protein Aple_092390 [Acrocarpospora pleiomorpha]|uniref:VOC domain-containing protein n=1 Tax=Acrocarpospora pleiomorpha TaxID=90975 RepID=A0A5M3XZ90_9ACTN|nr:VOC family protein [Acrocarpospora pleiomorpha]GES26340.1 hypothetical protein Aple_092390 [Acrocarpospora pleiomorpha]